MRRETHDQYSLRRGDMLPITEDGGIPVYISKDGKVHAKGFVDTNDNFEFYSQNNQFKVLTEDPVQNYSNEHIFTKTDNKIFSTESYEVLAGAFQNIYFPLAPYSNEEPPAHHKKYNLLNKKTKTSIKSFTTSYSNPVAFQFKFTGDGNVHSEPLVQSAWYGPFNQDVYIDSDLMVTSVNDLIIIKSGQLNKQPMTPTINNVQKVNFTSGASGHVYIETPSSPDHVYDATLNQNFDTKFFKFKNKDNVNRVQETSPAPRASGAIGILKNGVFVNSPRDSVSFSGLNVWHFDSVYEGDLDDCNGQIEPDNLMDNYNCYNYKALPKCLCDIHDDQNHSPLLGFAKDGFPIYGPYGYSESFNPSSQIKRLDTSYRLKQSASRLQGPDFSNYASGTFVQDYEYVSNLGDLDDHNGRSCVTPEFPNGTYAYFTTMTSGYQPAYPYVIGDTYYGKVSGDQGYNGSVTESPLYYRGYYSNRSDMLNLYTDPQINVWNVYGDTNLLSAGLRSEKIIFVSPHVIMQDTGVFLYTGKEQYYKTVNGAQQPATYSGNLRMATGNGDFLVRKESYSYPTSMNCKLMENNPLSGGMNFLYEDVDTDTSLMSNSPSTVTGTHFYSQYATHKKVKNKVYSGVWKGVIPAGTPFKVENWAFNGEMMGYDGKLKVRPVDPHPLTSGNIITLYAKVTGIGETYDEAYSDAMAISRDEINKKLNTLLVNSGVKNKNSRMRAWENLKEISK